MKTILMSIIGGICISVVLCLAACSEEHLKEDTIQAPHIASLHFSLSEASTRNPGDEVSLQSCEIYAFLCDLVGTIQEVQPIKKANVNLTTDYTLTFQLTQGWRYTIHLVAVPQNTPLQKWFLDKRNNNKVYIKEDERIKEVEETEMEYGKNSYISSILTDVLVEGGGWWSESFEYDKTKVDLNNNQPIKLLRSQVKVSVDDEKTWQHNGWTLCGFYGNLKGVVAPFNRETQHLGMIDKPTVKYPMEATYFELDSNKEFYVSEFDGDAEEGVEKCMKLVYKKGNEYRSVALFKRNVTNAATESPKLRLGHKSSFVRGKSYKIALLDRDLNALSNSKKSYNSPKEALQHPVNIPTTLLNNLYSSSATDDFTGNEIKILNSIGGDQSYYLYAWTPESGVQFKVQCNKNIQSVQVIPVGTSSEQRNLTYDSPKDNVCNCTFKFGNQNLSKYIIEVKLSDGTYLYRNVYFQRVNPVKLYLEFYRLYKDNMVFRMDLDSSPTITEEIQEQIVQEFKDQFNQWYGDKINDITFQRLEGCPNVYDKVRRYNEIKHRINEDNTITVTIGSFLNPNYKGNYATLSFYDNGDKRNLIDEKRNNPYKYLKVVPTPPYDGLWVKLNYIVK